MWQAIGDTRLKAREISCKIWQTRKIFPILHSAPCDNNYIWETRKIICQYYTIFLKLHNGLFQFLSIQRYGEPNFWNQYVLGRMNGWLMNPLELNLRQIDPWKNDALESFITQMRYLFLFTKPWKFFWKI